MPSLYHSLLISFKPHPRHAVLTFRKQESGVAKDTVPTAQHVYRATLGKLFNVCESLFPTSQRGPIRACTSQHCENQTRDAEPDNKPWLFLLL